MIRSRRFNLELGDKRSKPLTFVPSLLAIGKVISILTKIDLKKLMYEDRHVPVMFARHIWRNVAFIFGYKLDNIAIATNCHRTTVYNSIRQHESLMLIPNYKELYVAVLREFNQFKTQKNENDRRKFQRIEV